MASRRMFSKNVVNTSKFVMMSTDLQALYFQLGMNADDDGYVEYVTVLRMMALKEHLVNQLATNGYLTVYQDGIAHVEHWTTNNQIRKDRHTDSIYKNAELQEIEVIGNHLATKRQPSVVKGSVDKGSVDKNIVEQTRKKNGNLDTLIDEVIIEWKKISGQDKLSIKTESYRSQIRGRIKELKQRDIKEDTDILKAFIYVFTNKKEHAEDDEFRRFSVHDWNLRTLTRPKNFIAYLDETKYGKPKIEYSEDDL